MKEENLYRSVREMIAALIETKFLTAEGKRIARGIYLAAPG